MESDSWPGTKSDRPANSEETLLLASLKSLVASGEHQLDQMLSAIADAARRLSGASGAALAMWKDGEMVCRARSGESAPPLGARLSSETGISGECLRTGTAQHCSDTETDPLVDVEVCRSLGLRSIAVLPVQGWSRTNGILEVFSAAPGAFNDHHLALLAQLAALAERARALQPHGASPASAKAPAERPRLSRLLPASDRVTDVVFAFLDLRSRPFVLTAIGVVTVLLVGLAGWLGWRGPRTSSGNAPAAALQSAAPTVATPAALGHIPDNDPVWKPNPGGELLFPRGSKTSAGTPVKLASKVDVMSKKASARDRTPSDKGLATVSPQQTAESDASLDASSTSTSPVGESVTVEPLAITDDQSNPVPLNGVLVAKASLPELSAPVSQGVSGGRLVRHVSPVYPAQAKVQRLEGRVVLTALVAEDGRVRDLKVVEGIPVLAQSAMDAVKQWRYKPFLLDGKPVKRETTITIDFKLP